MALDGKAIKEEIPDKEMYEANARRAKDKDFQSRTPDSPESTRAVAPRSPISPKGHYNNLTLQRNSNGSLSPIQKGSSTTPPLASSAASTPNASTPILLSDTSRELSKLRKFLGALYQFGQDTSTECGDRVRSLILSLVNGGLSIEEFKQALQELVNFPLRPYVLPFLKSHIPILRRDLTSLAKVNHQTVLQYIRSNESTVFEIANAANETSSVDIFMPVENVPVSASLSAKSNTGERHQAVNGSSRILLKRRTSEGIYDHQNSHDWSDYVLQSKRSHLMMCTTANGHMFPNYPPLFDYSAAAVPSSHIDNFSNILDKNCLRDDRDMRTSNNGSGGSSAVPQPNTEIHRNSSNAIGSSGNSTSTVGSNASGSSNATTQASSALQSTNRLGGEEEWKNIHTMLNCISAMVDKTKRAITILQQRGVENPSPAQVNHQHSDTIAEMKRQTEEKVAEFRRNAEEAVNQVKRQAVIEIQRAVAAAETRAIEAMANERLKLEKMFADLHKTTSDESSGDRLSPPTVGTQNACWNCGRKANETCSGCNLARYCGSFCQHKDWEQHHQVCGTPARVDSNGHNKHTATITATTTRTQSIKVPPARTSPLTVQPQQPQQSSASSQQQSTSINITSNSNSIGTVNNVK